MAGLSVGSWLAAGISHRLRNPLCTYALIELVLAVCGVTFDAAYHQVLALISSVLPGMSESTAEVVKLVSCGSLVIGQSVLLGMTFPLMSAALTRNEPEKDGYILSMLYASNSLGAAVGVLVSGFVLVPKYGVALASVTAGGINALIGFTAWLMSTRLSQPSEGCVSHESKNESSAAMTSTGTSTSTTLPLIAAALTGFASFCYEIAWIRMLVLVLGSSLQAFELMLSAFIFGLAAGGWWIRNRAQNHPNPLMLAGYIQVLMAIAAIGTIPLYTVQFDLMAYILAALQRSEPGYALFTLFSQGIAIILMIPASFFAGMTLPVLTVSLKRATGSESAIGKLYGANTIGSILGVIAATHFLLPSLGLKGLLAFGAAVDLALGVALLLASYTRPAEGFAVLRLAVLATIAWSIPVFMSSFDNEAMVSGVFRSGKIAHRDDIDILFHESGKTAQVAVLATKSTNPKSYSIATNGKPDAGLCLKSPSCGDESTMVGLGLLPLLVKPNAKEIAVVGFGSGISTDAILRFPEVERVTTIEIERKMVEGARHFMERNRRAYEDPRSTILYNDARTVFLTRPKAYDVIVSEPSNPWVSGVAGLFSEEYYRILKNTLRDDGILVQWLHTYELGTATFAAFMNALAAVFPHYQVFYLQEGDIAIVASALPLPVRFPPQPIYADVAEALIYGAFYDVKNLQGLLLGNEEMFGPYLRGLQVAAHSDYFPAAAHAAVGDRFLGRRALDVYVPLMSPLPLRALMVGIEFPDFTGLPESLGELKERKANADNMLDAFIGGSPQWGEKSSIASFSANRIGNALGLLWDICNVYNVATDPHLSDYLAQLVISISSLSPNRLSTAALDLQNFADMCLTNDGAETQSIRAEAAVYKAILERDTVTVAKLGMTLVTTTNKSLRLRPSSVAQNLILTSTIAALVRNKDFENLTALLKSLGTRGRPTPQQPPEVRFILAYALGLQALKD